MQDFYNQKKILITGHTGFKGSWLSKILHSWGATVVGISLPPTIRPNLFEAFNFQYILRNYFVDIRDFHSLKSILKQEQPEIVFHLAAQALVRESYEDPLSTFSTNILGTANILQAIKESDSVKAIVVITTDKVYENKEWLYPYRENDNLGGYDPYSSSKAAADLLANCYSQSFFNPNNDSGTLLAIGRAGNVIGGGDWAKDRLVPDIIRSIFETNLPVNLRNPQSVRPWQHVFEPLEGYLMLAKDLYEGKKDRAGAWNFGPNKESFITVGELTRKAIEVTKRGSVNIVNDQSGKHEANILKLDITKASSILGWQPRLNLNSTLKLTFEWYKTYYDQPEIVVELSERYINNFFTSNVIQRN